VAVRLSKGVDVMIRGPSFRKVVIALAIPNEVLVEKFADFPAGEIEMFIDNFVTLNHVLIAFPHTPRHQAGHRCRIDNPLHTQMLFIQLLVNFAQLGQQLRSPALKLCHMLAEPWTEVPFSRAAPDCQFR
jgi:hypothetical protein